MAYTSTTDYFIRMLEIGNRKTFGLPFGEGFVTSAGSGSESVMQSSRTALLLHAEQASTSRLTRLFVILAKIIESRVSDERLIIPALVAFGFFLDAGVAGRAELDADWWQSTFKFVAKTHYKSTNLRKLDAAVIVYAGLATVDSVRQDALGKLANMLLHPFPKIRNVASDALFAHQPLDEMKRIDWSSPPKDLKAVVVKIRRKLVS
ncbi:MAG: hypothetical protein Q9214_000450 [Letrouitia sp. 1 TL-2023]